MRICAASRLFFLPEAEAVLFEGIRGGRRTAPWANLCSKIYLYADQEVLDQSYCNQSDRGLGISEKTGESL